MIKKIILGCIMGVCITLFFMQHDPFIFQIIEEYVTTNFGQLYKCKISGNIKNFSWVNASIEFKNVSCSLQELSQDWHWHCKKVRINFSWADLIKSKKINLNVSFDGLNASSSCVDFLPSILEHIKQFFAYSNLKIPIDIKSISFKKASGSFCQNNQYVELKWSSESKRIQDIFKTHINILDGILYHQNKIICNQIQGVIVLDAVISNSGIYYILTPDIRAYFSPQEPSPIGYCFFTGNWCDKYGRFQLYNNDQTIIINPIIVIKDNNQYQFQFQGMAPVAYASHFSNISQNYSLQGKIQGSCTGTFDNTLDLQGYAALQDVQINDSEWKMNTKCSFQKSQDFWHGDFILRDLFHAQLQGVWQWDQKISQEEISLSNSGEFYIPYINSMIKSNSFLCSFKHLTSGEINGNYQCRLQRNNESIDMHGDLQVKDKQYVVQGLIDQKAYCLTGSLNNKSFFSSFVYKDQEGKELITFAQKNDNWYTGSINLSGLHALSDKWLHYELQADGVLNLAMYYNNQKLFGKVFLSDKSNIRLPETYNFIKDLQFLWEWDFIKQKLSLHNMCIVLHEGKITSEEIFFHFPKSFSYSYYIPCIFDSCLLNLPHNLFGVISGSLIVKKEDYSAACVKGRFVIERSQLKENIFSLSFKKNYALNSFNVLSNFNCTYDCMCETKEPIRIDTPFLQANAHGLLHISGSMQSPQLNGHLSIPTGLLKFPYKPLFINKGFLHIESDHMNNPRFELIAQNKIKNHEIRLHASGSLNDHCILLSSNPPLTQEQIIGLLLVGSSQDSFNTLMPALLMNNLRTALFGSIQSDIFGNFFKIYPKYFSINLVPSFTDQTGRGGLRGAIEITVNDRLRALIQKNFTLTEDTRFELEYSVTDDITIRAIRDERSDIGAEIEMRWKF